MTVEQAVAGQLIHSCPLTPQRLFPRIVMPPSVFFRTSLVVFY